MKRALVLVLVRIPLALLVGAIVAPFVPFIFAADAVKEHRLSKWR